MCAILDKDVCAEVFGDKRNPASAGFLDWLSSTGRMVSGGQNKKELNDNGDFREWWKQAVLAGKVTSVNDNRVDQLQAQIESSGACRSNDTHIIALAQASGARLLYSNDKTLHRDFKNPNLIARPQGKIYSTNETKDFSPHRRKLLRQSRCPSP